MTNLEKLTAELEYWFDELKVNEEDKEKIISFSKQIAQKDEYTAIHSLEIAFLLAKAEERKAFDVNFGGTLYTGITHDIGKVAVDNETLEKTNDFIKSKTWSELDEKRMKIHPLVTYHLISPSNPHSANISLLHHLYQKNPYPENLPHQAIEYAKENPVVTYESKILSVADCYHACKRKNNFNNGEKITSKKIRSFLNQQRIGCEDIIDTFYDKEIFK